MSKELLLNVDYAPGEVHAEGLEADNAPTFLDEVIVEKAPKKKKTDENLTVEGGEDSNVFLQE